MKTDKELESEMREYGAKWREKESGDIKMRERKNFWERETEGEKKTEQKT